MATARINSPGIIGRVAVQQAQRTTIADPKYRLKPNVAITEIQGVSVPAPQNGDVLGFNAITGNYESVQPSGLNVNITNINGGAF